MLINFLDLFLLAKLIIRFTLLLMIVTTAIIFRKSSFIHHWSSSTHIPTWIGLITAAVIAASIYMRRVNFRTKAFRIGLPVLLLVGTASWMYTHPHLWESSEIKVMSICWILISLGLLIFSIGLMDWVLDKFISWKHHAGSRFFIQLLLGGLLSLACLNLAYYLIKVYYTHSPPELTQLVVANMYGSAVVLPLFSIFFGYKFLREWKKSELEAERLQKENARSQMMALKNHLDPHFLFNNLNILSSIMDKDLTLSKKYLDKFAEVYRIILKTEQSDLTTLREEMDLIESYIYLISVRFRDSVFFEMDIHTEDYAKAIPPLAIQMLIENAIKHNMANEQNPITITIRSDGNDSITVSNNLQKKKYAHTETNGSGLENIKNRYAFFSSEKMTVTETTDRFSVSLPLLKIEYD